MGVVVNLAGRVFGLLTAVEHIGTCIRPTGAKRALWHCRCACGSVVEVASNALLGGSAQSCGCVPRDRWGHRLPQSLRERVAAKLDISGGPSACWLWTGPRDRKGYGRLSRGRRGEGMVSAHRAAWELAHGPIPAGMFVCHRCDNPPCCNPAHLFVGTASDNNRDMREKGRYVHVAVVGTDHGSAKLNPEAVREIRRAWEEDRTKQRDLAARFGVNQQVVWSVIHRRAWAHVA